MRDAERLAILHQVDRGMIREESPAAIAEAALRPLRDLLGVPRAIVNLFDLEAGEVEWLAAIGRQRMHVGPGVRYPIALMGDLEGLRRGEPQIIDTPSLPPSSHKDALLASGVRRYMAVPMIVGDRLIGALIDDLLEFSRLGRKPLARAAVDMAALARDAWTELGASAAVQVTIGALPSVNGDPALLRQVWINLLSNALKYSARQPSPRIEVAGERAGADLVYRVSDNGAGFDMRYYDKLFRVFQRLHREDEFPGTGVGLAIVQRIITRHGGRVWAEAEVGKGAKFSFALPAPNPD